MLAASSGELAGRAGSNNHNICSDFRYFHVPTRRRAGGCKSEKLQASPMTARLDRRTIAKIPGCLEEVADLFMSEFFTSLYQSTPMSADF
jgi:hypothetical protein